jgi:hypothetical protein
MIPFTGRERENWKEHSPNLTNWARMECGPGAHAAVDEGQDDHSFDIPQQEQDTEDLSCRSFMSQNRNWFFELTGKRQPGPRG